MTSDGIHSDASGVHVASSRRGRMSEHPAFETTTHVGRIANYQTWLCCLMFRAKCSAWKALEDSFGKCIYIKGAVSGPLSSMYITIRMEWYYIWIL